MRETGERAERAKRFSLKNFINQEESFTVSCLGSFIDNTQYKITKRSEQALLQWGLIGETNKK